MKRLGTGVLALPASHSGPETQVRRQSAPEAQGPNMSPNRPTFRQLSTNPITVPIALKGATGRTAVSIEVAGHLAVFSWPGWTPAEVVAHVPGTTLPRPSKQTCSPERLACEKAAAGEWNTGGPDKPRRQK